MVGTLTWAGLDVHARSVHAAALIVPTGQVVRRVFGAESAPVVDWLAGLPQPLRGCYEAGPTGFGLVRMARAAGVDLEVVAPSKTPRAAADRVKTDARDALRLARLLMAGELAPIWVPSDQQEALRELARARDLVRQDLQAVQLRITSLLLRHGCVWPAGRSTASREHRRWQATQRFACPATTLVYEDLHGARDALERRKAALDADLSQAAMGSPDWPIIRRLRAFRGVSTLTAIGLHSEIGDWQRFRSPRQLMHWLGLTPSVDQSGERRSSGHITRAGSSYARRLLVEAATPARCRPNIGVELARRQAGLPEGLLQLSWHAQRRLHHQHQQLTSRGKRATVIRIAIARQLAGFLWAAAILDDRH